MSQERYSDEYVIVYTNGRTVQGHRVILSTSKVDILIRAKVQGAFSTYHEEESLLRGINNFRATFKLPTLTDNDKAECLAEEIAEQLKDQPCTNTTGANTVPGTERQFSDFPDLLNKCKLNVTTTRDGTILPACVPNLVQDIVLSNYTQTQYAASLSHTKYTGIGIGSDEDWIVVILTTGKPTGNFATGSSVPDNVQFNQCYASS
ncbi:hypothetical protein AgCh_032480 [Apium graveolens]